MLKKVVFSLPVELFKAAKIQAIKNDQNMTQYLISLIEKDTNENACNEEKEKP